MWPQLQQRSPVIIMRWHRTLLQKLNITWLEVAALLTSSRCTWTSDWRWRRRHTTEVLRRKKNWGMRRLVAWWYFRCESWRAFIGVPCFLLCNCNLLWGSRTKVQRFNSELNLSHCFSWSLSNGCFVCQCPVLLLALHAFFCASVEHFGHQSCHKNKLAVLLFYKSTEGEVCSGISQNGTRFRATHCKAHSKSPDCMGKLQPFPQNLPLVFYQCKCRHAGMFHLVHRIRVLKPHVTSGEVGAQVRISYLVLNGKSKCSARVFLFWNTVMTK